MTAEGGEADIALTTGTETDARGADDIGAIEQFLEELPAAGALRCAHPNVWSVLTAVALEAKVSEDREHPTCILHVITDGLLHLLFAFLTVDSLGSTLADIAGTIELRALAAQPQLVEWYALAFKS